MRITSTTTRTPLILSDAVESTISLLPVSCRPARYLNRDHCRRYFEIEVSSFEFCLLVGIGGGVPSLENDIRLGDVVVRQPGGIYGGVMQYDLGKRLLVDNR
ncbi:hypothetical protein BJX99DRAFT_236612 [Aspergillus californicus]